MARLFGVLVLIIGLALIAISAILFAGAQIDASIAVFIIGIIIMIIGYTIIRAYSLQEEKPSK